MSIVNRRCKILFMMFRLILYVLYKLKGRNYYWQRKKGGRKRAGKYGLKVAIRIQSSFIALQVIEEIKNIFGR